MTAIVERWFAIPIMKGEDGGTALEEPLLITVVTDHHLSTTLVWDGISTISEIAMVHPWRIIEVPVALRLI